MIIDLTHTTSGDVNTALLSARRSLGSPAVGMVLTLVIDTDERDHYDAMKAATQAAREHPSRILVVIRRPGHAEARLDAEVRVGGEQGPGETVLLRLYGPLADHAYAVVLPLLLPDTPVVTWWPGEPPGSPAEHPLGGLAQRRVTDAAADPRPVAALTRRASAYHPGDTDFAWTRLTPWRSVLAAVLDQPFAPIRRGVVEAERANPSAELLALWLERSLGVDVTRRKTAGPGITAARLVTTAGEIALTRPDGRLAMLRMPNRPDRPVALKRRDTSDLLAEELRRLDPDDTYAATVGHILVGRARESRKGTREGTRDGTREDTREDAREPRHDHARLNAGVQSLPDAPPDGRP